MQHVFHTGIQLWSLGLVAPGERGATGHGAGVRLGQHLTHGVGAEQHPPGPGRTWRWEENLGGTTQGKEISSSSESSVLLEGHVC